MESDLHGVERHAERIGDLLVGQALVLAQDQHRTIARRQARNVPVDAVVHFSSNECLVGAWSFIRDGRLLVDRHVADAMK